ncbi:MAG: extracellular solute-binding protein [Eubacteriales bacterium]
MKIFFKTSGILIFCLCLLMPVFTGCAKNDTEDSQTQVTTVAETLQDETTQLQPDLPEADYEGYEFNILMKGPDYIEWASQDIDVEASNGEVINDAVFNRNAFVEEKYNVMINGIPGGTGMAQMVKKSITAGDNAYDFVTANMYDTSTMATQGMLTDLYSIPMLDLTKPWWDQRANSDLSINHRLYMTVGDLLVMPNDATWLVIFNKTLIGDYNLTSPYDLVNEDKWYYDTMVEMTKGVTTDLDGNGKLDEFDLYGHISQYENAPGFILGFGEKVVSKDADDMPYLSINNDRALGCMQKVFDFLLDREYSINFQELTNYTRPFETTQHMFEENRGLFKTTAIQLVIRMRNMETDFGIVPMPKLDAAQETYYNFVHPTTSCVSVPVSGIDLERTGIILEALAAKSRYTVREAYYDISLNYKYLRDAESIKMLDIILETRMYDISQIYNWGGIGSIFHEMMGSRSSDFSSLYAKREKQAEKAMQKTVDAYLEVG